MLKYEIYQFILLSYCFIHCIFDVFDVNIAFDAQCLTYQCPSLLSMNTSTILKHGVVMR